MYGWVLAHVWISTFSGDGDMLRMFSIRLGRLSSPGRYILVLYCTELVTARLSGGEVGGLRHFCIVAGSSLQVCQYYQSINLVT